MQAPSISVWNQRAPLGGLRCQWWDNDAERCAEKSTVAAKSTSTGRFWYLCALHAECIGDAGWDKALLPPNDKLRHEPL
jgi:hypothetical protein